MSNRHIEMSLLYFTLEGLLTILRVLLTIDAQIFLGQISDFFFLFIFTGTGLHGPRILHDPTIN